MKYKVENGIYNLGFELSLLEKKLFIEFEDMLDTKVLKDKELKILLNLFP